MVGGSGTAHAAGLGVTPPAPAPASLTLQQAVDLALAGRDTRVSLDYQQPALRPGEPCGWPARQWGLTLTGSGTQNQDSQVATDFGSNLTYSAFSAPPSPCKRNGTAWGARRRPTRWLSP